MVKDYTHLYLLLLSPDLIVALQSGLLSLYLTKYFRPFIHVYYFRKKWHTHIKGGFSCTFSDEVSIQHLINLHNYINIIIDLVVLYSFITFSVPFLFMPIISIICKKGFSFFETLILTNYWQTFISSLSLSQLLGFMANSATFIFIYVSNFSKLLTHSTLFVTNGVGWVSQPCTDSY